VGSSRQPFSKFSLKQYIVQADKDIYNTLQLRLMIDEKASGKTVGTLDFFDFDIHSRRVAIGIFVAKPFQNRGYAARAMTLAKQYAFNYLKVRQIYCFVPEKNISSRKLMEKSGFAGDGKLHNWIDTPQGFDNVIVYQVFAQ
jgi:diamine N-acetyltransferase